MTSSTLQFVVATGLVAAWGWMLGRPLLTNLFRRSRRDSIGHFRYQQAALGQQLDEGHRSGGRWAGRPRPLADWRAQPVERRRLQLLLAFAMATFASALLAIALRGLFVRLFVIMVLLFAAHLCIATVIGTVQLRRAEQERMARLAAPADNGARPSTSRARTGRRREGAAHHDHHQPPVEAEWYEAGPFEGADDDRSDHEDQWAVAAMGRDPFADAGPEAGVYDEGFFEPIPELQFKPLQLDDSLIQPRAGDPARLADGTEQIEAADPADVATPAASASAPASAAAASADIAAPASASADVAGHADPAGPDEADPHDPAGVGRGEATFITAPAERPRLPKRNKARPIYIESQLDEGDERARAVND